MLKVEKLKAKKNKKMHVNGVFSSLKNGWIKMELTMLK